MYGHEKHFCRKIDRLGQQMYIEVFWADEEVKYVCQKFTFDFSKCSSKLAWKWLCIVKHGYIFVHITINQQNV